ncbi:hypothetical protein N7505_007300 [Penicillium chrysogenum]|uniref:Uncharacterized protein n=1 Tax=Penicillium chrysogenum TaxID=5076 RepID=A0ABQ8WCY0_PENCH|nr:hypothetical protein N7505_007300 [Penicillium chrysogenum]
MVDLTTVCLNYLWIRNVKPTIDSTERYARQEDPEMSSALRAAPMSLLLLFFWRAFAQGKDRSEFEFTYSNR